MNGHTSGHASSALTVISVEIGDLRPLKKPKVLPESYAGNLKAAGL